MNSQFLFLSLVTVLFSQASIALNGFTRLSSCGSAAIVSGETCTDIKIDLDFAGCDLKSAKQSPKKVICDGSLIKARFQDGDYRYEARFSKTQEDGWGAGTWKSSGPLRQWKKIEDATTTKRAAAMTSIAPTNTAAALTTTTPETGSLFKYSAFVDLRFSSFTSNDHITVPNAYAESGFAIEDGAFYVNYEKNRVSFLLDAAIRRSKDSDTNPASAVPNQSSNNNIALAVDRSQMFLKYKIVDGFYFDFGQMDTPFGVELNDSKDRIFGKTGLVYDLTLPVTHAGAFLEFSKNGFSAKVFAANPNNKGTFGSAASGDNTTEYGTALGFANDNYRVQVGALSRPINTADLGSRANRVLGDLTAGITFGIFSLDLEYNQISDPSKNSITPLDVTDLEKSGSGFLTLISLKPIDELVLALRYEMIEDDPAGLGLKSANAFGASVHYRLASELELRTEYVGYNYKDMNDLKWNDSRFNIATVLTF